MQPQETPVTRTFIATATALIAAGTLLSSAAQACISCEYVPEVVRSHATSPLAYGRGDNAVSHGSSGGYSVKRRIAKSEPVSKSVKAAKVEQDKPAKVAKVAKTEKVKIAKADPVETTPAESENSAITVAAAAADATVKDVPVAKVEAAAKPTDCKKFFASVGMTLTVPCDQ
jgi:hypothetical protein